MLINELQKRKLKFQGKYAKAVYSRKQGRLLLPNGEGIPAWNGKNLENQS